VFTVDPDLVVLAESVGVRDWVPKPGESISKSSGIPHCELSSRQSGGQVTCV
jgi:hypothetical protein